MPPEKCKIEAQTDELEVDGLRVSVTRKDIKYLHLYVRPPRAAEEPGTVAVSAPLGYSDERIKLYIIQKRSWIVAKKGQIEGHERQSERRFVSGETHYYRGRGYRLLVVHKSAGPHEVTLHNDYMRVEVHHGATPQSVGEALYEWYRQRLSEQLLLLVPRWEALLGVTVSRWEVRRMSSRWGSCQTVDKTVLFNTELAKKPMPCVEYVVAHELTHLIERLHTPRFEALLDAHLPRWRELQRELNDFIL